MSKDDYDAGYAGGVRNERQTEIMDDFDAGYQQGLSAGYTKSITLIRHLQRGLSSEIFNFPALRQREILSEAMELISPQIKPIGRDEADDEFFLRGDNAREI
tara:strand:+ start:529 stop:834 length:306 start_codon:yes stop_codon:yes gene_type:complete